MLLKQQHADDWRARVISAVGRPAFGSVMMSILSEFCNADMCSAFSLGGTTPAIILAESVNPDRSPFARVASQRYAKGHWRRDVETLYNLRRAQPAELTARRATTSIRDPRYRCDCYLEGGVGERLSMYRAGVPLTLNAYIVSCSSHSFINCVDWADRNAAYLLAALQRHQELINRSKEFDVQAPVCIASFLISMDVGLSTREVEVLAHAVSGASVLETAGALGLAVTSVRTYRRRGLAKCGVQTCKQLRALLRTQPTTQV